MASLVCRNFSKIVRQRSLIMAARTYSDNAYIEPHKGKVASADASMPDALGHAVGPERFELLAQLHGEEDPFEMNIKKKAAGTKEDPTLVSSIYEKRMVGCICEEDTLAISWMYLYRSQPKRCECGYWFKLVDVKHVDYGQ